MSNKKRCTWVNPHNKLDVEYHDTQWGVPVFDDRLLFEMLILEGAQAGLAWTTILKKRENYVFLELQKEFGSFSNYIWAFVDNKPIQNHFKDISEIPATTELSDTISKDLKKRGMSFVGSTIIYAFMQAVGMVNDHQIDCFCRNR
ncbi:MAG: DNA-3-methyladenine glycosylase I [Gammaproteobacteria bacterium]|nr:MAG: DNA-3-methyladenine glycosylase I [Gammaproteobacteria bacterium]